jgi:NAD(P)-dependent dehydrogenase (short-subunit alcohol dehydrogenase family)
MQIKDRVFIVTGASSGIGLATAIALSGGGAEVALLARSTDALQELAEKLQASFPVTVDMTQFDRVREAIGPVHRHYGRIDGLINNAGRSYAASVEEINPALFDEIFHLNVLGPIVAMEAVIPLMRAQRRRKHREHQFGDCVHDCSAVQRVPVFKARAARIQSCGARQIGKGSHRGQRNLSVHHGDKLRQEQHGESGRRRTVGQLSRRRQARLRRRSRATSHRRRTGSVFRE